MLDPRTVEDHPLAEPVPTLRPSEYTAALIQGLRARAGWANGAHALEIGSGSGVVLAALGDLGAASLTGVDIEAAAVESGAELLDEIGYGAISQLCRGDMWQPVSGRRFDLVAANLPHFPMVRGDFSGRLPSWSFGGPDGRLLLDRFLKGLPEHLAPGGRAIITHNAFVNLDLSRAILDELHLALRISATVTVHISGDKADLMTRAIARVEEGRTIHRYGPYTFGDMHIVEIGTPEVLG